MRWVRLAALLGFAGCQPITCHGTTLEDELPLPLVPYEVVSPCVYRYYGEPSRPGFAHPEVNGLAYGGFTVDTRQHLVTFTACDPDAGIRGKVELAGAGGGLAIRAVAGTQALVLSDAAVIALEQAGAVASNALALLYMARGHLHHICTDKNFESDARGGPWSPRFKRFLDGARLKLDDPENLVEVEGHQGPHPKAYHEQVMRELLNETRGTEYGSEGFRAGVLRALRTLAARIRTPGSELNQLVTRTAP